jgi:hypothetical protein
MAWNENEPTHANHHPAQPWLETWFWNEDGSEVCRAYPDTPDMRRVGLAGKLETTDPIVETDSGCYGPHGKYRLLIAAAPEMARLLLKHLGLGSSLGIDEQREVEAVLRKAGVLE